MIACFAVWAALLIRNVSMVAVVHVVDDDESFRTAVAGLLGGVGYEVQSTSQPRTIAG